MTTTNGNDKREGIETMEDRVIIFDTTLRDGEQSPGATMNTAEKLRIASKLEELGVDVIEAGFPAASPGDFDAVEQIAKLIQNSTVCGLARAIPKDIEICWEAVKHAKHPRIHTFVSTSEIHLEHQMKKSKAEVLKIARESVRLAKSFCNDVEFSAMDATRTEDLDFLCQVLAVAIEEGAKTLNIPDTVGYTTPNEMMELIDYIRDYTPGIKNVVISVHCHNDLGLATANTLAAVQAGARQVEVTVNGIGERAGNTSLEEIVMALKTRKDVFGPDSKVDTTKIYPISRLVTSITGIVVQPNKAIVGANAFAHESGIHQDGMLKNRNTYEIMKPEDVGVSGTDIVLGKHSGRRAVASFVEKFGYQLSDEHLDLVYDELMKLADHKKNITPEDLEAIIHENILRGGDYYSLEYVHYAGGNTVNPVANIGIGINGELSNFNENGNGSVDATIKAIKGAIGLKKVEVLRYVVGAINDGTDSQAEVSIRMRKGDIIVLGRGSDHDVVVASCKAFVNGLNRIKYRTDNPMPNGVEPSGIMKTHKMTRFG